MKRKKSKTDRWTFYIIVALLISLFILINLRLIVKALGFKICVEKGIKSNVWCFIGKSDSCSNVGWWGGVCLPMHICQQYKGCVGPLVEEGEE